MKPMPVLRTWTCSALLCACPIAQAGRPMVVDDATILDPGNCQLEAWLQHAPQQREHWAMPSCRAGAWELGIGLGRIDPEASAAYVARQLQAKTIFRPLRTNGWGIGLTVADQYRPGGGLSGDISALVPLSVSLLDDRVLVHANAGWLHRQGGRGAATWALGTEWTAAPGLALTLESYGQQHGRAWIQAGMRIDAVPGRLALDAGIGQRFGLRSVAPYFTVGLTVAAPLLR